MSNKNPPANVPPAKLNSLPAEYVTETLVTLRQLGDLPKLTGKASDDLAFRERAAQFLDICERDGLRPAVETAALAFGVTRETLYRWEHGINCTETRQNDVQRLKQTIYAVLEQGGLDGKISPVLTIWLNKNWMQYSDSVTLKTPDRPNYTNYIDPAEIMLRYADVEPPDIPDFDG